MCPSAFNLGETCCINSSSIKSLGVPPKVTRKDLVCSSAMCSNLITWEFFSLKHWQQSLTFHITYLFINSLSKGKVMTARFRRGLLYVHFSGESYSFLKAGRRKFLNTSKPQCHNATQMAIRAFLRKGDGRTKGRHMRNRNTDFKARGLPKHWPHCPLWRFQEFFPGSGPVTWLKVD